MQLRRAGRSVLRVRASGHGRGGRERSNGADAVARNPDLAAEPIRVGHHVFRRNRRHKHAVESGLKEMLDSGEQFLGVPSFSPRCVSHRHHHRQTKMPKELTAKEARQQHLKNCEP